MCGRGVGKVSSSPAARSWSYSGWAGKRQRGDGEGRATCSGAAQVSDLTLEVGTVAFLVWPVVLCLHSGGMSSGIVVEGGNGIPEPSPYHGPCRGATIWLECFFNFLNSVLKHIRNCFHSLLSSFHAAGITRADALSSQQAGLPGNGLGLAHCSCNKYFSKPFYLES